MNNTRKFKKITNRRLLTNTKSKRGNNIVKKCLELSILCDLQINLVIYDPRINKLVEYKSHSNFDAEEVKTQILKK